jgi:hypothetical protein
MRDEGQGTVPTVVNDSRRPARCVPDRPVNAGYLRSLPGQPDTPAHLRAGGLTRCANRPSQQRVSPCDDWLAQSW